MDELNSIGRPDAAEIMFSERILSDDDYHREQQYSSCQEEDDTAERTTKDIMHAMTSGARFSDDTSSGSESPDTSSTNPADFYTGM